MPEDNPRHYRSLADTCRQLKSGALSAETLARETLERIDALEPKLKAFARKDGDAAVTRAAELDQARDSGKPLGALHGVPIAIKDLLFTKAEATASGTLVMADFKPDFDATVVSRLKDAGAVIIGKTQLTEGAFGAHHPEIDPPRNPWNPDYWPGVSSSGSGVAVAAGLAYGALGTDTGGSIRFPCASCGLVGLKPTYGRVSRHGAFELAGSLDHIGPMTRTVEDAARMLAVIAGRDVHDASSLDAPVPNYSGALDEGIAHLKVGIDWRYVTDGVDPEIVDGVRRAAELLTGLGAEVCDVAIPGDYRQLVDEWGLTTGVECARAHADYYPRLKHMYGPVLAGLIELGSSVGADKYAELESVRERFRTALDQIFADVDLLLAPCMPIASPTVTDMDTAVADDEARAAFITFTAPFDYSGHPTLTLPLDLNAAGLPRSVQLIGPHLGEGLLLRAGAAFESATGGLSYPAL